MSDIGNVELRNALEDGAVLKALQKGAAQAVKMNKLLGLPVSTVRDGKVVWVPPEEIRLEENDPSTKAG